MKRHFWTEYETELVRAYNSTDSAASKSKIFAELMPALNIIINNTMHRRRINYQHSDDIKQCCYMHIIRYIDRITNYTAALQYVTLTINSAVLEYIRTEINSKEQACDYSESNIDIACDDVNTDMIITDIVAALKIKMKKYSTSKRYYLLQALLQYFVDRQYLHMTYTDYLDTHNIVYDTHNIHILQRLGFTSTVVDDIFGWNGTYKQLKNNHYNVTKFKNYGKRIKK